MKVPPSKLRAARLAAADVFLAEGLDGTPYGGDVTFFRNMAEISEPWSQYGEAPILVEVRTTERRGVVKVAIVPHHPSKLSNEQAAALAALLARAAAIARKVEAAIARVAEETS